MTPLIFLVFVFVGGLCFYFGTHVLKKPRGILIFLALTAVLLFLAQDLLPSWLSLLTSPSWLSDAATALRKGCLALPSWLAPGVVVIVLTKLLMLASGPTFFIRRFSISLVTLTVIATLCFFIVRLAPGSPFSGEKKIDPDVLKNIEKKWGYDKPLPVQYWNNIKGYMNGDMGFSTLYPDRDVNELLIPAFKVSLILGSISFIIALLMGIPLGMFAAARQNKLGDYFSMSIAIGGICIPNFLLGPLLVLLLAFALPPLIEQWFWYVFVAGVCAPAVGSVVLFALRRPLSSFGLAGLGCLVLLIILLVPFKPAGWPESWSDPEELKKLILPAFTLSFVHIAYISRLTRAGMLDVMRKDYIRTARAKGLTEKNVFVRHGLKNGITPVVSYIGPMAALVVTGSIVVEKVFEIPGVGQHFVKSALNRDYGLAMGTIMVYSALVIVFNLIVDILYGYLDPRVKLQ